MPTQATAARPGSEEKIEIMRQRQAAGQQIFHPKDERIEWKRYTCNTEFISVDEMMAALRERSGRWSDAE